MTVLSHQTLWDLSVGGEDGTPPIDGDDRSIKTASEGSAAESREPLISGHHKDGFRSASYDLRVGPQFYLSKPRGRRRGPIGQLGPTNRLLEVGPNEVVLIISHERLAVPNDLVGHLSLKLDVLLNGMIMANQSQIDAGYKGRIFALLYNLSDGPITLRHLDPVIRVEFARLDQPTSEPYSGEYKEGFDLSNVVTRRIRSSLSDMSNEVRAMRIRFTSIAVLGVLAVAVAVATILGPVQGQASDARADARLAEEVARSNADALNSAQARLEVLAAELDALRAQLPATTTTTPP